MVVMASITFSYGTTKTMDINQLQYFAEIAKQKNFTRAAQICHVAQPALSQQVRKLETQLDLKLLKRLPRGAELTSSKRG